MRTDRVDAYGTRTLRVNGTLHQISIGRAHARTRVLVHIHDLETRIINAAPGEFIRHLTIEPTTDYQPRGAPCGRPRKKP